MKQYAASPIIQEILEDSRQYFNVDWQEELFGKVWNVDTAQGFGLDIWGRIVVISRELRVPQGGYFGYNTAPSQSWNTFNNGTFYAGGGVTDVYRLTDQAYRVLILSKALSNISATDGKSLNLVINELFKDRGRAYVNDLGSMSMRITFEFALEPWEKSVLAAPNVLPRPAGVKLQIVELPLPNVFGFAEQGPGVAGFNYGTFLNDGNVINAY